MNLQQLKYVLAIYKEGSITKASHALFCAQPNVSSALKSLESELHIRIFDRTLNGVELTPQGEAFISYAVNIMAQVERLENIGNESVDPGGPGDFRFPCLLLHAGAVAVDE